MALVSKFSDVLPADDLAAVHYLVMSATDPERMAGSNPYGITFWFGLAQPRNVVEDVISLFLRPLLALERNSAVVGAEWWLGRLSPPYDDNFKPGAHKDSGEHPSTGKLGSPVISSIFYLTTVHDGPLVVFDGEPDTSLGAYDYVVPRQNLFVTFPGDRWHSVMASRHLSPTARAEGTGVEGEVDPVRLSLVVNWWHYRIAPRPVPNMEFVGADYDGRIYPELMHARLP